MVPCVSHHGAGRDRRARSPARSILAHSLSFRRRARGAERSAPGAACALPPRDEAPASEALPVGRDPRLHGLALLPRIRTALGGLRREGSPPSCAPTTTTRARRSGDRGEASPEGVPGLVGVDGYLVRTSTSRRQAEALARLDVPLVSRPATLPIVVAQTLDCLPQGRGNNKSPHRPRPPAHLRRSRAPRGCRRHRHPLAHRPRY